MPWLIRAARSLKTAYVMATKVPPLDDVTRLSDRVIRILGGNPGKASFFMLHMWTRARLTDDKSVHFARYFGNILILKERGDRKLTEFVACAI
jgi:hypothetical protein